jgi:hypothetical protein
MSETGDIYLMPTWQKKVAPIIFFAKKATVILAITSRPVSENFVAQKLALMHEAETRWHSRCIRA